MGPHRGAAELPMVAQPRTATKPLLAAHPRTAAKLGPVNLVAQAAYAAPVAARLSRELKSLVAPLGESWATA